MRTVETPEGDRYLLVKRSAESSLVRDPETGEEQHLPTAELTPVDAGPLETAAGAVPAPTRRLLTAARDEQALGLLVELRRRGPLTVRAVLSDYDLCESDVLGVLTEFRAAGLVTETEVGGERGYRLTEAGREALGPLLS